MLIENTIYYLGSRTQCVLDTHRVVCVKNLNELPDSIGCVLIIANDIDDQLEEFHRLRKYWSWRVYVTSSSLLSEHLSDGVWQETQVVQCDEHRHRLETLKVNQEIDPLLGWLGLDETRQLLPFRDSNSASVYRYPLLDAYLPDLESPDRFLFSETKRDLLFNRNLVDRIRVCNQCGGGHLNYIETCPECHHFDIEEQVSLHCFTCGHVAEQSRFRRGGKLQCSKCLTLLRHIGVDYDRPLENHVCNQCHHAFAEAHTMVNCLSCEYQAEVTKLVVRKIYALGIGEQGQYMLRHGKQLSLPQFMLKGKVDPNYFVSVLAWLNKIALRHQEVHLLLGLCLPRLSEYARTKGDAKTFALTEQITHRLNNLFRESDLCCQYKQDIVFVLMPKTGRKEFPILQQKIEQLCNLIDEPDFVLNVFNWELPNKELNEEPLLWLQQCLGEIYAV